MAMRNPNIQRLWCESCCNSVMDCECDLWDDFDPRGKEAGSVNRMGGGVAMGEIRVVNGVAFDVNGEILPDADQEQFVGGDYVTDYEDYAAPWATPVCPRQTCQGGTNVWCLECGEEPDVCHCVAPVDWYCGSCGTDFEFDPQDSENYNPEDEWDDAAVEEELDIIVAEAVKGCVCEPVKQYFCQECGVKRKTPDEPWEPTGMTPTSTKTTAPATTYASKTVKSYNSKAYGYSSWDDDDWGGWSKDRHYNGDFLYLPTSGLKVYASSSDNIRKAGEFIPDWGLYLDSVWHPSQWRYEYIDWPDMSTPSNDLLAVEAIIEAYERVLDGQDVEVGCIGGHGRTGTVLACMAVLEGLSPDDAMKLVWQSYCKHAIETKSQEWWIHWFSHALFGTPLPSKPVGGIYDYGDYGSYKSSGVVSKVKQQGGGYGKPKSTTTGPIITAGVATTCSQGDHYIYWREGHAMCPNKKTSDPNLSGDDNCRWWSRDCDNFKHHGTGSYNVERYEKWAEEQEEKKRRNTKMQNVDGYLVPAPKKGDKHHNPDQKGGCQCDTCRYRRLGGSAFLTTVEDAAAERREKEERLKPSGAAPHKAREKSPDDNWIYVAQSNGSIISVRVADSWEPKPPTKVGASVTAGTRLNGYVWTNSVGWVYEGLHKLPEELYLARSQTKNPKEGDIHGTIQAIQNFAEAVAPLGKPKRSKPRKKKNVNKANKRNMKNNKNRRKK